MGRILKRPMAFLCALILLFGAISAGFVNRIAADSINSQEDKRILFGKDGTYLQLSHQIKKSPEAIETTVNLKGNSNEFTLFDILSLRAYVPDGCGSTSTGKTTQSETMGAGYSYIQFDEGTTYVASNNSNLKKTQTKYDIADLSLAFWCYNGSENTEKLSTSKTGTFQLSSNETAADHNLIRYPMNDITLQSGWNYIELPLRDWYYPYGNGETNLGEFDIHNIQSFAISGYENSNGTVRRFTDFKLILKKDTEENLFDITNLGKYIPEGQGSASVGKTIQADPMGAGYSYIQFDEGTTYVASNNSNLKKTQTKYDIADLSLAFWCYNGSENTEKLSTSKTGTLQLSSNETAADHNLIRYPMNDITLQSGWNYVELPLSDWYYPYGNGETNLGEFDIHNIQSFAISGYENSNGTVRRFTDFQLKPINSIAVKAVNANELFDNYMIFSNTNNSNETSPYALFVTEAGYPAVVYNNKQFTLNKNVATGNDVKIAVKRDSEGYINFYINDKFIRKSNMPVSEGGSPVTTHYIGCDGEEKQNFEGEITEVRIYENNEKLMGSWNPIINNNEISTIISDNSGNKNDAVIKEKTEQLIGNIPFSCDAIIQGNGSSTQTMVAEKLFESIDASKYNSKNLKLVMDIEVENITNPGNISEFGFIDGQIELTSSGKPDIQERSIAVSSLLWLNGKNKYELSISYGNITGGDIDLSKINYMRIYINKWSKIFKDKIKIRINNVRLIQSVEIVPTLFSDGMMFQQNKPMNLWGMGTIGNPVVANLYKNDNLVETQSTTVDSNGKWKLAFEKRNGSYDNYRIELSVGGKVKRINNIAIGELWIAGGQSNMELIVSKDIDAEKIIKNADNPNLRVFLEPTYPYGQFGKQLSTPANDIPNAKWGYGDNASSVGNMSSLAYTFANKLQKQLDVPVGIINSAIGGSVIEGWLSREAVENDSAVKEALIKYNLYYDENNLPEYAGDLSTLYNQKIGPLEGLNVAGLIWYQGESNGSRSELYDLEFDLLKRSWSKVFGYANEDMPVIFTQVAPYYRHDINMGNNQLGYLSMYMERAWKLSETKNTAMLTIYDLPLEHVKDGESSDPIHPRTKTPIGERFAKSAINMVYGGNKEYTAPVYKTMDIKDGAIYITLDHVGSGLKAIGNIEDIHGFSIAGENGIYVNAKAKIIDKNKVKVWNERVENPKNAMYAFDNYNQTANLCNSEGIPASPFRTVAFNDSTSSPDPSLKYFLPQDWIYADKDVWVYDLSNTENDNRFTGYRPAFSVNGGTYSYDSGVKSEGEASLKVTHNGDFTLSPIISYKSINKDWSNYKTISAKISSDADIRVSLVLKSGGSSYTVLAVGGNSCVEISASNHSFQNAEFDLTSLNVNDKPVNEVKAILASLDGVEFKVETKVSGEVFFDEFIFGMNNKVDHAEEIEKIINYIDKYDITTVKFNDVNKINALVGDIDSLLNDSSITEKDKNNLENAKEKAQKLLDRIDTAEKMLRASEITDVTGVNKDNVELSNKKALNTAKEKSEEILNGDYKNNFSDSEKASVKLDLSRINDALNSIVKAEKFISEISKLPNIDDIQLKDLQLIKSTEKLLNNLTANEKKMIGDNKINLVKAILEKAVEMENISYHPVIIEGANQKWEKGSNNSIKFRSNADFAEFVKVTIDGNDLESNCYTAKSGSIVIELNPNYLETLSHGKHTLSIISVNGHADTEFIIMGSETIKTHNNENNTLSPKTGGTYFICSLLVVFVISFLSMGILLIRKNFKKNN